MSDPTTANVAIARALGLDPTHIRKGGVTLTLDGDLGPIITVESFLTDSNGHRYAIDDEVATELSRYKLVLLKDDQ